MAREYDMIHKFDEKNWHIKKFKIKCMVIDKGLLKTISGKVKKPSKPEMMP